MALPGHARLSSSIFVVDSEPGFIAELDAMLSTKRVYQLDEVAHLADGHLAC